MKNKKKKILKNRIEIYLNSDLIKKLEKRAKKNLLSLPEQIEDILRRSCINTKKSVVDEKLDDKLIGLFSRRRR